MPRWAIFPGLLLVPLASGLVLARALQPPSLAIPPVGVVLGNVTVVNPGVGRDAGRTLTLGETIERVESVSRSEDRVGAYAGAFVLPGLIDLHVHHPPAWAPGERELFSLLFLVHGVTGIRDTGNLFGSIESHRAYAFIRAAIFMRLGRAPTTLMIFTRATSNFPSPRLAR